MKSRKDLDKQRAEVTDLKAQRATLADTPELSRAEVRAAVRQHLVDAQAEAAHVIGVRLLHVAGRVHGGDPLLSMPSGGRVLDLAPLLAWAVGPDEIMARIEPLLADIPEGLGEAARACRLAEFDAQILAAEIAEERIVEALEAAGVPVQRRADADPAAVLALPESTDGR